MDQNNKKEIINSLLDYHSKVIVELGMGDGSLLKHMAENDTDNKTIYIGIEIDRKKYTESDKPLPHIRFIEGSIIDIIPLFPDCSLDFVFSILPDPDFIDRYKQDLWMDFYSVLFSKIKYGGSFRLVTEITDDLLNPVPDNKFEDWLEWINMTFNSFGFNTLSINEGFPSEYFSPCLDRFRQDPQRIRIATFDFQKLNICEGK